MQVTFGEVSTELPDGWTDGSIIKFSDPARPAEEGSAQPSIVITRADDAGDDLSGLLSAHAEQLSDTLIGFEVQGTGSTRGRRGDVHYLEHRFGEAQEYSQILLLTVVAKTVYIVTGTAGTAEYDELRPRFVEAAAKLGC